jgi:hypothetical protein
VTFEHRGPSEVSGIAAVRQRFRVQDWVFAGQSGDRNTLRIGVIVIAPRFRT